jgi:hypothetical protein
MSDITKGSWLFGTKYNFETFELGEKRYINELSSRVNAAAGMFGRRKGMRFRCGKVGNGTNVIRVS